MSLLALSCILQESRALLVKLLLSKQSNLQTTKVTSENPDPEDAFADEDAFRSLKDPSENNSPIQKVKLIDNNQERLL